jgi:hypothetical protein
MLRFPFLNIKIFIDLIYRRIFLDMLRYLRPISPTRYARIRYKIEKNKIFFINEKDKI